MQPNIIYNQGTGSGSESESHSFITMMLKTITVTVGFVCILVSQSLVTGQTLIQQQICGDTFNKVVTDSVNSIDPEDIKKHMQDIEVIEPKGNGKGKGNQKTIELEHVTIEFKDLKSQEVTNKAVETKATVLIYYGGNAQAASGQKTNFKAWMEFLRRAFSGNDKKKTVVLFTMALNLKFNFELKNDKLNMEIKECEALLKMTESNKNIYIKKGKEDMEKQLKASLCEVSKILSNIVNEQWRASLVIDPSDKDKLNVKSVTQTDGKCLLIGINLRSNDQEHGSSTAHPPMTGSGVSIAREYFYILLNNINHNDQLNKNVEEMSIQISPDEVSKLIPGVSETDPVDIKISLQYGIEGDKVALKGEIEGYASKSDKAIFSVTFEAKLNLQPKLKGNKVAFPSSDILALEVNSQFSNIGTTGQLNPEYLDTLLRKITQNNIIPAFNNLKLTVRIPQLDGQTHFKQQENTIQILSE